MTTTARVVPDVASFSVDDGFWYSVPSHLSQNIEVGSIVRVPLSGRRVRGWVVEMSHVREGDLKEIAGVSGGLPVFDADLLRTLVWAAHHYVAPVSVLLGRATPPNLPRSVPEASEPTAPTGDESALSDLITRSASGLAVPTTAFVDSWHWLGWIRELGRVLTANRSILIVAASVAEVETIRDAATRLWGDLVVGVTGDDDAADTMAWEKAQSAPRLVIGTPRTSAWRVPRLALAIVLEESRRAMKDRQTPTLHVREVMITRGRVEGFNVVFFGPTPGVELLASGADLIRPRNRAWGLVEVVDRSEEAPGSGFLSSRTVAALGAMTAAGRKSFVFTHRRLGFGSTRCAKCRTLRSCAGCGARLPRVDECPRCHTAVGPCATCGASRFEELGTVPERLVKELDRRIGKGAASVHPADSPITVGTERDLADLDELALAVAADVDGMLLGTGYRTSEEALRQLARLGSLVTGRSSRLMLQTSRSESLLVATLRRGDPIPYLERVLVERGKERMPPSTEMIALEIRGQIPDGVDEDLAGLDGRADVLGPMPVDEGQRWLISGQLGKARLALRPIVGRWRDRGSTVRVDADPIDL